MSTNLQSILDKISDVYNDRRSETFIELSLHDAISICRFETATIKFMSTIMVGSKFWKSDEDGKAAFNLNIFRSRAFVHRPKSVFPDCDSFDEIIQGFFFLCFRRLEDRQRIRFCLSDSDNYVIVLLMGKAPTYRRDDDPPWNVVAGSIISTHKSGAIVEYLGVSDEEFSVSTFYHPSIKGCRQNPEVSKLFHQRSLRYDDGEGCGIGTFLTVFIQKRLPKRFMGCKIFLQLQPKSKTGVLLFLNKLRFERTDTAPLDIMDSIIIKPDSKLFMSSCDILKSLSARCCVSPATAGVDIQKRGTKNTLVNEDVCSQPKMIQRVKKDHDYYRGLIYTHESDFDHNFNFDMHDLTVCDSGWQTDDYISQEEEEDIRNIFSAQDLLTSCLADGEFNKRMRFLRKLYRIRDQHLSTVVKNSPMNTKAKNSQINKQSTPMAEAVITSHKIAHGSSITNLPIPGVGTRPAEEKKPKAITTQKKGSSCALPQGETERTDPEGFRQYCPPSSMTLTDQPCLSILETTISSPLEASKKEPSRKYIAPLSFLKWRTPVLTPHAMPGTKLTVSGHLVGGLPRTGFLDPVSIGTNRPLDLLPQRHQKTPSEPDEIPPAPTTLTDGTHLNILEMMRSPPSKSSMKKSVRTDIDPLSFHEMEKASFKRPLEHVRASSRHNTTPYNRRKSQSDPIPISRFRSRPVEPQIAERLRRFQRQDQEAEDAERRDKEMAAAELQRKHERHSAVTRQYTPANNERQPHSDPIPIPRFRSRPAESHIAEMVQRFQRQDQEAAAAEMRDRELAAANRKEKNRNCSAVTRHYTPANSERKPHSDPMKCSRFRSLPAKSRISRSSPRLNQNADAARFPRSKETYTAPKQSSRLDNPNLLSIVKDHVNEFEKGKISVLFGGMSDLDHSDDGWSSSEYCTDIEEETFFKKEPRTYKPSDLRDDEDNFDQDQRHRLRYLRMLYEISDFHTIRGNLPVTESSPVICQDTIITDQNGCSSCEVSSKITEEKGGEIANISHHSVIERNELKTDGPRSNKRRASINNKDKEDGVARKVSRIAIDRIPEETTQPSGNVRSPNMEQQTSSNDENRQKICDQEVYQTSTGEASPNKKVPELASNKIRPKDSAKAFDQRSTGEGSSNMEHHTSTNFGNKEKDSTQEICQTSTGKSSPFKGRLKLTSNGNRQHQDSSTEADQSSAEEFPVERSLIPLYLRTSNIEKSKAETNNQNRQSPPILYRQSNINTCLCDSLACALQYLGYKELSQNVHEFGKANETETYIRKSLFHYLLQEVLIKDWRFKNFFQATKMDVDKFNILQNTRERGIKVFTLVGSNGSTNHVVASVDGYIFDPTQTHALPLNQENLDICSGGTYIKISEGRWYKDNPKKPKRRTRGKKRKEHF